MAIQGTLIMEDHTVSFMCRYNEDGTDFKATVTVNDMGPKAKTRMETYECGADDLLKALSIALHPDGAPIYTVDYPAAERTQRAIRWIP